MNQNPFQPPKTETYGYKGCEFKADGFLKWYPLVLAVVSALMVAREWHGGIWGLGLIYLFILALSLKALFDLIKNPAFRMDGEGFQINQILSVLHLRWADLQSLNDLDDGYSYQLRDGRTRKFKLVIFKNDTQRKVREALLEGYEASRKAGDTKESGKG